MKITERFLVCDNCGQTYGVDDRCMSFSWHRKGARECGWQCGRKWDYCEKCVAKKNLKKP